MSHPKASHRVPVAGTSPHSKFGSAADKFSHRSPIPSGKPAIQQGSCTSDPLHDLLCRYTSIQLQSCPKSGKLKLVNANTVENLPQALKEFAGAASRHPELMPVHDVLRKEWKRRQAKTTLWGRFKGGLRTTNCD